MQISLLQNRDLQTDDRINLKKSPEPKSPQSRYLFGLICKKMRKLFVVYLILIAGFSAFAQQDAAFTHYMFNTQAVNPAYAGTRDALTITGLHRSQWLNFEGAPQTQTLTAHSPIFVKNAGVGISVLNDNIGFANTTAFYLDFSYQIELAEKHWLSFGIKGGLNYRNTDFSNMSLYDSDDPDFIYDKHSGWLPNIGAGIYYYSPKMYAGFSIPKFIENDFGTGTNTSFNEMAGEKKHIYFIAGYLAEMNPDWKLKPTTFLKMTPNAPLALDVSAQLIYKEKVWAGAMFRPGDAAGLLAGYFINPQFSVGYSFDWSYANRTFVYNNGSHEIVLRYDFNFFNEKEIVSPRYF